VLSGSKVQIAALILFDPLLPLLGQLLQGQIFFFKVKVFRWFLTISVKRSKQNAIPFLKPIFIADISLCMLHFIPSRFFFQKNAQFRPHDCVSIFGIAFCEPKIPRNNSATEAAIEAQILYSIFNVSVTLPAVHPPANREISLKSQHAQELAARCYKSSKSPAEPATGSWHAANPRPSPSRRPTRSCLVSAP